MNISTLRRRGLVRAGVGALTTAVIASTALTVLPAGAVGGNAVKVSDVTVIEGNAGTTAARFTLTFKNDPIGVEEVTFATRSSSADAAEDFTAVTQVVTTRAMVRTYTVDVPVSGDAFDEANELFAVSLSAPKNTDISDGTGVGTIVNDDGPPVELNVDTTSVLEGDSPRTETLGVSISRPAQLPVSASWQTVPGTAQANDFVPASGQFTIPAGSTAATIPVDVLGDTRNEVNEGFTLRITDVRNAVVDDTTSSSYNMTLIDDDGAPALSVADVDITEGTGGAAAAVFTLTVAPPSELPVTVRYATTAVDETRPAGFTAAVGTASFPADVATQTITVPVLTDAWNEHDETFYLNLSDATNVIVDDPQAVAVIRDDDAAPNVVVGPATVTATEGPGATLPFTVKLSQKSGKAVSVVTAATPSGSTSTADLDTAPITVNFAPYADFGTVAAVNVPVVDDALDEDDEGVTFGATSATHATVTAGGVTGRIVDNDATPSLSAPNVTIGEQDIGQVLAPVRVNLSAVSGRAVKIDYATSAGTAAAGSDFNSTTGTLIIPAGDPYGTVDVVVNGDDLDEDDETFTVSFSTPSNATAPVGPATVTIVDADADVNISLADLSISEGSEGTADAVVPVRLSGAADRVVTVDYATAPGTATAADFTATTGTLTFAKGETEKLVSVALTTDAMDEFDETFTLVLNNPTNVVLADGNAAVTIVDDDAPPQLLFDPASIIEPADGAPWSIMHFRLSAASGKPIKVNMATQDGTAVANADYLPKTGTIFINPGVTTLKMQMVKVYADSLDEAQEQFGVRFYRPENVTLPNALGTISIVDSDDPVSVSITDATVQEGDSASTDLLFDVTLSAPSGQPVTVGYKTANGTATAGSDFKLTDATVTFPAGSTSTTVAIPAFADTSDEDDETFTVSLVSPVNAVVGDGTATATIIDNDPVPTVSIAGTQVVETNSGSPGVALTVTLTGKTQRTVTAVLATADDTATAGSDYTATTTTVTFAPGERSKTITVGIIGDTVREPSERFTVAFGDVTNANAGGPATVEILDND